MENESNLDECIVSFDFYVSVSNQAVIMKPFNTISIGDPVYHDNSLIGYAISNTDIDGYCKVRLC